MTNHFRNDGTRIFAWLLFSMSTVLATRPLLAEEAPAAELPLQKLVMFTSGVSYFEHRGEIDGDAQVDLPCHVDDVNDLLKSLVLQDLGGGEIKAVTYGSKDPVARRLASFSIDLSAEPTLALLLRQVRGERVRLELDPPLEGVVVGVELRREPGSKTDAAPVEWLNLLTERGLRSVPLHTLTGIELMNAQLNAEFRQALAVLAESHHNEQKTVSLRFQGEGRRAVRVGYIRESPLWKTSYRLVLNDDQPALLQGWAMVENTSEVDWNDVRLTLVSGRPISFVMNLYEPLYVRRPQVPLELYGAIAPPLYESALSGRSKPSATAGISGGMGGGYFGSGGGGGFAGGLGGGVDAAVVEKDDEPLDAGTSVRSAAQGEEVGELFHYEIKSPVTLSRQTSAMLPIVNDSVQVEKISIYTAAVHEKHPLHGVKLKNTTKLHLMQGPVTVFDQGAYAGDARIADLPPGEERKLSYALDLETEVASKTDERPRQLTTVRVVKGSLYALHRIERETRYTALHTGAHGQTLEIEHPRDDDWQLTAPKPAETTRNEIRFALQLKPGQPQTLTVTEAKQEHEKFVVGALRSETTQFFLESDQVSPAVKAALRELADRRAKIADLEAQQSRRHKELGAISQGQERLRANMAVLDRTHELYQSYLNKLIRQEAEVEKLEAQVRETQLKIAEQAVELERFIATLNLR